MALLAHKVRLTLQAPQAQPGLGEWQCTLDIELNRVAIRFSQNRGRIKEAGCAQTGPAHVSTDGCIHIGLLPRLKVFRSSHPQATDAFDLDAITFGEVTGSITGGTVSFSPAATATAL